MMQVRRIVGAKPATSFGPTKPTFAENGATVTASPALDHIALTVPNLASTTKSNG
jgi:hypothetical protein